MLFDMGRNLDLPERPNARLWNKSYDCNINGMMSDRLIPTLKPTLFTHP